MGSDGMRTRFRAHNFVTRAAVLSAFTLIFASFGRRRCNPDSFPGTYPTDDTLSSSPSTNNCNRSGEYKNSLEAVVVFTMVRFDLLELQLQSIDYPLEYLFVVNNYANKDIKASTLSAVRSYSGCENHTRVRGEECLNPNIARVLLLASPHNLGFSGSVNLGLKAVLLYNISYAFFNGDDTRFRPGRIQVAKHIIDTNPGVCIFHFEGYSSFVLTKRGIKMIGPFDENFWPAYAEDCDYWYRSQLAACKVYYRGGYVPAKRTPESIAAAFLDHGDVRQPNVLSSATHSSYPELGHLIGLTMHGERGRFAYLVRKWGFNACDAYHNVVNAWRDGDVILDPISQDVLRRERKYVIPYNGSDNFRDIRRWLVDDWEKPGAVSSRAVNVKEAPPSLVWQETDYIFLDLLF